MLKIFVFLLIMFYVNFAHGDDYITENIINGCYPINDSLKAIFVLNEYTCANGYYLPADAIQCVPCLSGYECSGGTYAFDETQDQGIKYKLPIDEPVVGGCDDDLIADGNLTAKFTPNEYTCSGGYYLPADAIECVACPADSYCAGGTYTFNETVPQGIESCPNNWYSPTGSSSVAQCGRILHVGDSVVYLRSVKQTTPSLNVQIGDDIFYGNMTTADVPMNINTERKLKVSYDDTTYSVYDDTVTIPK